MKHSIEGQSDFLYHTSCPSCGSTDANSVYSDGHQFCFSCNHYTPSPSSDNDSYHHNIPTIGCVPQGRKEVAIKDLTPLTDVFRAIPRRGLTEESVKKYKIDINLNRDVDVAHRYPYFKDGVHVANKVRQREVKDFYWEGDSKHVELYGQSLFPPGSAKTITLVEGEIDSASVYQMQGSRYPVVSVCSAGSAVRDVKRNYEYLNSFDKIVVCFDADEPKFKPDGTTFFPGQEAAQKVADLFAPGKCAILTLQQGKDPSEYLQKGLEKEFMREWWQAPVSRPEGIRDGTEMWDELINRPDKFSVPFPWQGLQDMTYGLRLSESVLLMAETGIGKSSVFYAIEHAVMTNPEVIERGYGVGLLHFEETNADTALNLMSLHAGKPYHLPDTEKTEAELRQVYDDIINNDRLLFYDSFGSNEIDIVLDKVRHMAVMGCKYIFIDHLSIIVSSQDGDERKDLDEISTKLKMLTIELDIAVCCIIHTNRQGQARGSAGPEKVANLHIAMERDKEDPDPFRRCVTKLTIKKNRFGRKTGPACYLYYDMSTGRLIELDEDAVMKFEQGLPLTQADLPWSI